MKKIKEFMAEKFSIRTNYLLTLLIISIFLTMVCFSYALFTTSSTKNNAVNIITGDLKTSLTSDYLDKNNSITIPSNTTKSILLSIKNINNVSAKYNMYYSSANDLTNVIIGYSKASDNLSSTTNIVLEPNAIKNIAVKIANNSTNNVTITFGENVGLVSKTLPLPNNTKIVATLVDDNEITCRRATNLHTEECTQKDENSYCSGAGYITENKTTITYGNLGINNQLTSGDAFDCDVNGDGTYDSETERFYYVSGLDGDDTSDYATLIYYNNVVSGVANNETTFAYNTDSSTYLGPQTAIRQLPTIAQWKITLKNNTRNIKDETNVTRVTGFDYTGYAARLLTTQEVNKACNITIGTNTTGELDNCNYLFENTKYTNSSLNTYGFWLENTSLSYQNNAFSINGDYRNASIHNVYDALSFGVRPAIEIQKSNILY